MTKTEYFEQLRRAMTGLPEADVQKTLDYYDELIADAQEEGKTEEEVLSALPSPGDVAAQMRPEPMRKPKIQWGKWGAIILAGFLVSLIAQQLIWSKISWQSFSGAKAEQIDQKAESYSTSADINTTDAESSKNLISLGGYQLSENRATYAISDITEFEIDSSVLGIAVTAENRNDIEIKWYDCSEWQCDVELDDGVWSITYSDCNGDIVRNATNGIIGVSISVPRNYSAAYEFDTTAGGISMKDCGAERVQISGDAGGYKLTDCVIEDLQIESTAGGILINDCSGDSLQIQTTAGAVKIEEGDFLSLQIESTAGAIKGSLAGSREDYTVESEVEIGTTNLHNGGDGDRSLDVSATAGAVSITFIDD